MVAWKSEKIVDAHQHFWDLGRGHNYPWLQDRPLGVGVCGDVTAIAEKSYLPVHLQTDAGGYDLVKSVHIEAVSSDPIEETRWLQELADRHGFPHGIVAAAQLHQTGIEAALEAQRGFTNVRGIRHIVNWHNDPSLTFTERSDFLTDPAWLAGFGLLSKYDLSFDLQLYPSQMADAAVVARAHPETLIILNHAGMPVDRDDAGVEQWREGMASLAACDNVAVKISGLGMLDWHWSEDSIRPYVLETIDRFSTDRAMFGSNFPVDRLYSSFGALYGAFERIVAGFSAVEQNKLFAGNALRLYRL